MHRVTNIKGMNAYGAVTPAPGFRRDRVAEIQKLFDLIISLDSGPFDKPFDTLRVPSLSIDFRRNDEKRYFVIS